MVCKSCKYLSGCWSQCVIAQIVGNFVGFFEWTHVGLKVGEMEWEERGMGTGR